MTHSSTPAQMHLAQLINYLENVLFLSQTTAYVANCTEEITEIDGIKMINKSFVKSFFTKNNSTDSFGFWRDIDSNVTTYIF
jgi:hypothetical protein